MTRRLLSIAVLAITTIAIAAPSAQARDLEPGEAEWVITTNDLTSPTAKVTDVSDNAQGPTIPTGCANINTGRTASGRNSLSTIFGQIDYRDGTMWQSSVWTYRTPAAARASFAKLQSSSLLLCNDSFTGLVGDDVADMPAVLVDRAKKVPGATQPRFAVATSQVLTQPATARPGYTNEFSYTVFTVVDDAVVQVNVFQSKAVSAAQRADAGRAATSLARRYAASV